MKAFMPRLERGKIVKQHLNLSKLFEGETIFYAFKNLRGNPLSVCQMC